MLVGCISGVYSTIALTTPLVYTWSHGELNDGSNPNKVKPATKQNVEAVAKEKTAKPQGKVVTKIKRTRRSKKN